MTIRQERILRIFLISPLWIVQQNCNLYGPCGDLKAFLQLLSTRKWSVLSSILLPTCFNNIFVNDFYFGTREYFRFLAGLSPLCINFQVQSTLHALLLSPKPHGGWQRRQMLKVTLSHHIQAETNKYIHSNQQRRWENI